MTTNEQHVHNGGNQCPYCNSGNIEGGDIHIDFGCAWQDVTCNDCEKKWQDTYTLTGYTSK